MAHSIARGVFRMQAPPVLHSFAAIVGPKEGEGPYAACFDQIESDSYFGEETWEKAESRMQQNTVRLALQKGNLSPDQVDFICSGDLNNQCIGSTYGLRPLQIPFLGLYGACSTMAEGLLLTSLLLDSSIGSYAVAATSSHFSTAERQFRFPLSYGGQRTPTAQWTCTASGAVVLAKAPKQTSLPRIVGACIGKIVDLEVTDLNNMGAAMAPAAADTILRYLNATGQKPSDFDAIVTGDLGQIGSQLLLELVRAQSPYDLEGVHQDCGAMMFDSETQDTHAGGSGCGCSASLLCGHFLPSLQTGALKQILFAATGALMSPTASQQGESIPGISHLVQICGKELPEWACS